MAKRKPGLHKDVASIFEGAAPTPDKESSGSASREPAESTPIKLDKPKRIEEKNSSVLQAAPAPAKPVVAPAKPAVADTGVVPVPRPKPKPPSPTIELMDRRQKTMLFFIPVLLILFVATLYRTFKSDSSVQTPKETAKPQNSSFEEAVTLETDFEISWQMPLPYETLQDPMYVGRKEGFTAEVLGEDGTVEEIIVGKDIFVRAIYYSEEGRSAVVGGDIGNELEIVYEGQQVLGATVIKIGKDVVEFERNGRRFLKSVEFKMD